MSRQDTVRIEDFNTDRLQDLLLANHASAETVAHVIQRLRAFMELFVLRRTFNDFGQVENVMGYWIEFCPVKPDLLSVWEKLYPAWPNPLSGDICLGAGGIRIAKMQVIVPPAPV